VLLTRLPLTPKGAFDLHVLSLPPAFVLSQDQTLKFKEFNLDCVTTQIDRAPLTPAFPPERCTHQKHRSGRCLLSKVAKATRKDTAAYASLSRLHLSKSRHPNGCRIQGETLRTVQRSVATSSFRRRRFRPAVDRPHIRPSIPGVKKKFEVPSPNFRFLLYP
jgi:hypothetical protein